ncbi:hypothetical protein JW921_07550 [Candidatus Fermentibacterales bacterium]|nr:hypothetical protein [Candidatus Fermentibacterales bacterium]
MPTYEYKCRDCGHCLEAFQKMSDEPLTECPECGGSLRRLIGKGAGFIFRGSGFYATDYREGGCGTDNCCPGNSCSGCGDKR